MLLEQPKHVTSQLLSTTMYLLAELGTYHTHLFSKLVKQFKLVIEHAKARDLSRAVWALGALQHQDDALCSAAGKQMLV